MELPTPVGVEVSRDSFVDVVAQRCHQGVVGGQSGGGGSGIGVAFLDHAKDGVADRFAAGRRNVGGGVFGAIDVTHRHRVVSRPGVIHADGETEVIARLRGRMRRVDADGRERTFVPDASDAVGSRGAEVGAGSAAGEQEEPKTDHSASVNAQRELYCPRGIHSDVRIQHLALVTMILPATSWNYRVNRGNPGMSFRHPQAKGSRCHGFRSRRRGRRAGSVLGFRAAPTPWNLRHKAQTCSDKPRMAHTISRAKNRPKTRCRHLQDRRRPSPRKNRTTLAAPA